MGVLEERQYKVKTHLSQMESKLKEIIFESPGVREFLEKHHPLCLASVWRAWDVLGEKCELYLEGKIPFHSEPKEVKQFLLIQGGTKPHPIYENEVAPVYAETTSYETPDSVHQASLDLFALAHHVAQKRK